MGEIQVINPTNEEIIGTVSLGTAEDAGGYKQSGHGRELSLHGVEEFLETKQVHINLSERPIGWY